MASCRFSNGAKKFVDTLGNDAVAGGGRFSGACHGDKKTKELIFASYSTVSHLIPLLCSAVGQAYSGRLWGRREGRLSGRANFRKIYEFVKQWEPE